jgi:hypothetical protein
MKKDKEDKKRRLTLSRETIQILDDPTLLELVRGGTGSQFRICPIDISRDAC